MRARLATRLAVTPDQYRKVAYWTLFLLSLIVLTGAAVRLTSSGLGCPTWPKCYGRVYPPLQTHALIEFGNRMLSGLVGVGTVVAAVLAFTRKPFRRDLAILAGLLPLGVIAQAVLGGFTVRYDLAPGFVMAHYGLSMVILVPAVMLAWRATHERWHGSATRRCAWHAGTSKPARVTADPGQASTHGAGQPAQPSASGGAGGSAASRTTSAR